MLWIELSVSIRELKRIGGATSVYETNEGANTGYAVCNQYQLQCDPSDTGYNDDIISWLTVGKDKRFWKTKFSAVFASKP